MRKIMDAERCSIMERFDELGGTLDGRKATIAGRCEDFPRVIALDGTGLSVEFSWHALRRRVDSGMVSL